LLYIKESLNLICVFR